MPQTNHWSGSGRLRGGRWGVWFFIAALRLLGLRLTYALTVPVAGFYAFVGPDVAATMDFHRRVFGPQPWWKRRWLVFKHFLSFGRALIDRTSILAGETQHFSFTFEGEHHVREAVAAGKGVLLLTAHIGNWEAAGQLLERLDVPVNVTGFDNEAPAVRTLLNQSSKAKFRLLPLTGSPTDALPLVAALRRGEIVAMLVDRDYGKAAACVPFLDGIAAFPIGPYQLAAIARSPVVAVFSLREPGGHYHFFGFPARYPQMPPHSRRQEGFDEHVLDFARNLEGILKRDPLQWYNFYPFWQSAGAPAGHPP
jgi:predicted LPLAT superfamily acyltransferase